MSQWIVWPAIPFNIFPLPFYTMLRTPTLLNRRNLALWCIYIDENIDEIEENEILLEDC